MDKVAFIDTPFTTKVEYERYVRGEIELPVGSMDVSDGLSEAMAGASVASAEAWGPLEYPPARKAALQQQFEAQAGAGGRLPLKTVHALIFSAEERKECACRVRRQPMHFFCKVPLSRHVHVRADGFDNFDEDLQATSDGGCKVDMSWADTLKFMEDNL